MKIFYENENKERIKKHIELVKEIMLLIGNILHLDRNELLKRASSHDATKFSDDEFLGYMLLGDEKEHSRLLNEKEKYITTKAIEHHYENNSHHPQHYSDCNKMTDLDILEMVADWLAISIEKNKPLIVTNDYKFNDKNYQKILNYIKIAIEKLNIVKSSDS